MWIELLRSSKLVWIGPGHIFSSTDWIHLEDLVAVEAPLDSHAKAKENEYPPQQL
jgi:hypothetical protein